MSREILEPSLHGKSVGAIAPRRESVGLDEIVVGKDVLELISSAMYVDPMTIYREYIQNSADAIDAAKRVGLIGEGQRGRVDIFVDSNSRAVRIRDNGTGIGRHEFTRRLTSIGASAKRGSSARGFRGVGRLAGLGYAQEVVFRSRTAGEPKVSELRWDCRQLRAALRATDDNQEIGELIRSVVTSQLIDEGDYPDRFFEVELKGVVRQKSDRLMSPVAIAEYLSQVAPVPFSPGFKFAAEITAALSAEVALGDLDIHIDGLDGPVYRPHRDKFIDDDKRAVVFDSVDFLEIPSIDGEVAAIAWILHHEYEGALPNGALIKGLRLRSGNVQVGDHALLEDLYPEPRFNSWSVGEVHVLDKRIVPNGRRDHFEQNAHFHNLVNHLSPAARDIARRCRTSSIKRKLLRELEVHKEAVLDTIGVISQGSIGRTERDRLALSAEQTLLQMGKIASKEVMLAEDGEIANVTIRKLKHNLAKVMKEDQSATSPLSRLPKNQRKMYEHFFELVYKCSVNRVAAKALIDRILLTIK